MIELFTAWDAVVNAVGAVVMIAFGAWVLTLTPRTRSTKMLALFAVAFGAVYVPSNLLVWTGWERYALWLPYKSVLYLLGAYSVLALLDELLDEFGPPARRWWRPALGITAGMVLGPFAVSAVAGFPGYEIPAGDPDWGLASVLAESVSFGLFMGALLALPLVLALIHHDPPQGREEETRTRALLVGAALIFQPALNGGFILVMVVRGTELLAPFGNNLVLREVLFFAGFLVLAGIWLYNSYAVPSWSSEARNMALFVLAVLLLGIAQPVLLGPYISAAQGPFWGVGRLLSVLILGYAILQHEILGIEAKFRWGVSKTTVAGIFIAVFFATSEAAQVLFADVAGGNELIGVGAAALLVFALAPLQRFGDQLAAKAVPEGPGPADPVAPDAMTQPPDRASPDADDEETYRVTVEKYLADGELTRDEERHLARLATRLGIHAERALELRREVEQALDE